MFRSDMWALKNKETDKLISENEVLCLDIKGDNGYPMIFTSRKIARSHKRQDETVVKVAVTVRKAA